MVKKAITRASAPKKEPKVDDPKEPENQEQPEGQAPTMKSTDDLAEELAEGKGLVRRLVSIFNSNPGEVAAVMALLRAWSEQ